MNEEQYITIKDALLTNILTNISEVPDNMLAEHYAAKNLECYLRSLEVLERMHRNG